MSQLGTDILELEFNYISQTVAQTVEDRYRFLNFYIGIATAVGSLIAGLISLSSQTTPQVLLYSVAGLSLFVSLVGVVFLLIMIRIRQAWFESLKAMNKIKDHVLKSQPDLEPALAWRAHNLPKAYKFASIHFMASLLIILISSSFGAIGIFSCLLTQAGSNSDRLLIAAASGLLFLLLQIIYYRLALANNL